MLMLSSIHMNAQVPLAAMHAYATTLPTPHLTMMWYSSAHQPIILVQINLVFIGLHMSQDFVHQELQVLSAVFWQIESSCY